MRLFVTYNGAPAIIHGYGPGKNGKPLAILLVAGTNHPISAELSECHLPWLPKKLERKVRRYVKRETQEALVDVIKKNVGIA